MMRATKMWFDRGVAFLGALVVICLVALHAWAQNQPAAPAGVAQPAVSAAAARQSPAPQPQGAAQQSPANAPSNAAQASGSAKTADSAARAEGDQPFRPRLPMYYTRVVTEEQRQRIYGIQKDYYPKISALRKQLEALIAEQNAKIEAVLTPEQKAELDKIRAEAASRRKSNADDTTGSATGGN